MLHDAATLAPDMELVLALLLDVARGLGHLHGKAIMVGRVLGLGFYNHETLKPIQNTVSLQDLLAWWRV